MKYVAQKWKNFATVDNNVWNYFYKEKIIFDFFFQNVSSYLRLQHREFDLVQCILNLKLKADTNH
jgi:hypothetical protein